MLEGSVDLARKRRVPVPTILEARRILVVPNACHSVVNKDVVKGSGSEVGDVAAIRLQGSL